MVLQPRPVMLRGTVIAGVLAPMDQLNLIIGVFGLIVLVLGVGAEVVRKFLATEPFLALAIGFLLGPHVAGVVDPHAWQVDHRAVLEQGARLTVAVALMEIGLSLRAGALRGMARSLALRLGIVLPVMWLAGGLLVLLVLDIGLWPALLIGAAAAATDPVVASAIVNGDVAREKLPVRIRDPLSAESAANDGLVYVFLMLPLLFMTSPDSALAEWLLKGVLLGVVVAVAAGAAFGWVAGKVARWSRTDEEYSEPALLVFTTAVALVVLALVRLIGSDGILAVLVAAVVFDHTIRQEEEEEKRMRNAVNRFLMLPIFLLLGAALPVSEWLALGWPALALLGLVLLVRRIPVFLAIRPASRQVRDLQAALFTGWFGPIGIAALYYILLGTKQTGDERIWIIGSLLITASVVIHGLTAVPFTLWYARRGEPG